MRWKLILIASVLSSITGAALGILLFFLLDGSTKMPILSPGALVISCLVPAVVVMYACIFVYRHTARRRTLQALLTAVVAIFFTLTLVLSVVLITRNRSRRFTTTLGLTILNPL